MTNNIREIDVELLFGFGAFGKFNRAGNAETGAVDDKIDPTVLVHDFVNGLRDAFFIRHIDPHMGRKPRPGRIAPAELVNPEPSG